MRLLSIDSGSCLLLLPQNQLFVMRRCQKSPLVVKVTSTGAPVWLSWVSIQLLLLARVMGQAPHWGPC